MSNRVLPDVLHVAMILQTAVIKYRPGRTGSLPRRCLLPMCPQGSLYKKQRQLIQRNGPLRMSYMTSQRIQTTAVERTKYRQGEWKTALLQICPTERVERHLILPCRARRAGATAAVLSRGTARNRAGGRSCRRALAARASHARRRSCSAAVGICGAIDTRSGTCSS